MSICAGQTADPTGVIDASPAIQACIDAGTELLLPPGTFSLQKQLTIAHPFTLGTAGAPATAPGCARPGGPRCAVLRASSTDAGGTLVTGTNNSVVLRHIVLVRACCTEEVSSSCHSSDSQNSVYRDRFRPKESKSTFSAKSKSKTTRTVNRLRHKNIASSS